MTISSHLLSEQITIAAGTPQENTVWAEVEPLGAGLREGEGGRLSVVRRYRIRLRRDEWNPAHGQSLLWNGRNLAVVTHALSPGDRRLIEVQAEEHLA